VKKLIGFITIVGLFACVLLGGFAPRIPTQGECSSFHPHEADFGGPSGVNRVLDWLIQSGQFNAWSGTSGRVIVQFSYNGLVGFLSYGQGNPTMFISSRGIDYIREQTSGLTKVTSQKGFDAVKQGLGNCQRSYAQSLVSVPAQEPVSVPAPNPAATSTSAAMVLGLATLVLFGGGGLLAFARR